MTLTQRTTLIIVSLVAGLGVLSMAMLWGLWGLRSDVYAAFHEYREFRLIHEAEVAVAAAEAQLASESPDHESVIVRLQVATEQLGAFLAYQDVQDRLGPEHELDELDLIRPAMNGLPSVLDQLDQARGKQTSPSETAQAVAALREILLSLDHAAKVLDTGAGGLRDAANAKLRSAIIVAAALCLAIVLATALISLSQYRGVMRPLRLLREGVRRMSCGKLTEQVSVVGNDEFGELTRDFNRMAVELDGLYRTLESKVAEKSKELVRSERLASVGFLAAGVAHEINTPLNIISGYAELTLQRLRNGVEEAQGDTETQQAVQIMRDESFRCKEIMEKLLSLAKPGERCRQRVSLAHIADEVVSIVSRLQRYRDRRLALRVGASDPLTVVGSPTELKQVLMNLTINALEAVKPGAGEVVIDGRCRNHLVELSVSDNGHGMAAKTLEHVFEPFFTSRRASNARGAGLGLSITHAIVEAHEGRITAESNGPGMGSRFIVQLPSAAGNGNHDRNTLQANERSAGAGR